MGGAWAAESALDPGEAWPRKSWMVAMSAARRSGSQTSAIMPYSAPPSSREASRLHRAMTSARRRIIRRASGYRRWPELARAANSPREWPRATSMRSAVWKPNSCSSTRRIMILAAMMAGWAFSVAVRAALGPSAMVRERGMPRRSSVSWRNGIQVRGKASSQGVAIPIR